MTAPIAARVEDWRAAMPAQKGALADDAAALAGFVRAGEELLAALPERRDRDRGRQRTADRVLGACRALRGRFIGLHADGVYEALTRGGERRERLSDLAFAAAEAFPGLVPTREQLGAERRHVQEDKEGREIDQGVFFRGLLRSPDAGPRLMESMLAPSPRAERLLPDFRRSGRLDLPTVRLRRSGRAAHLTLCNEHCLNAEDDRLVDDLETAVDLVLMDDGTGVGVVRGGVMTHPRYRGRRVFSAGINLSDLHGGRISFVDFLLRREMGCLGKLMHGLHPEPDADGLTRQAVHKPWVAAVDAFAIGGGMQLLLLFDRVIAEKDAYFSLPAAQEGIVPGVAGLRLGRFTGSRLARRIILSGQRIRATDPEAGLVCDEVVDADAVEGAVERAAEELDAPAVVENRRMLALAEEPPDRLREYLSEFAAVQASRLYSKDVLDKVAAAWSRSGRARKGAGDGADRRG
ncbi:(3,5-dihydroxyphenyl)acetyl-CoA 1,2-dioxygenase DpgC [Nocardiopsis baichengensis]|uniref:(3,5-dihydroxyphenyl)acetyl-CoA 1,2-dioxygenase DpgC n=1 Tax=Nocardiopsis baichengensis TaxID=280240 RepID=UPI000345119C|nr:(3,5-dihydroxyphenyl)acetyl-CoA 1,2-dioxygenase DpgC [Nocardiopsis baichengensis]